MRIALLEFKGGFLTDEFGKIFSDLFIRRSDFYKKIIKILSSGPKEQREIGQALDGKQHGRISEYLQELVLAGFVIRDRAWNIRAGQDSELSKYRLSDNYLRFYLKYMEKNLGKINRNAFALKSLSSLPEWSVIMGFQFENLVLSNRKSLHYLLNIAAEDIICENPFFQRQTARIRGCQIDYMIQTKFSTLYICEIKFSKNAVESSVVKEVQSKIAALKFPKGFSYRPVLIHVNGVTDEVMDSDYFSAIIDMGELFNG